MSLSKFTIYQNEKKEAKVVKGCYLNRLKIMLLATFFDVIKKAELKLSFNLKNLL
jgi:hypothetical protein